MDQNKINKLKSSGWQVGDADDFVFKPLETKFRRWDFDWEILERTEKWALLCQRINESLCSFNVSRIKKFKQQTIGSKIIEPQERLASAEQYGIYAWNYGSNYERAKAKYDELNNESKTD